MWTKKQTYQKRWLKKCKKLIYVRICLCFSLIVWKIIISHDFIFYQWRELIAQYQGRFLLTEIIHQIRGAWTADRNTMKIMNLVLMMSLYHHHQLSKKIVVEEVPTKKVRKIHLIKRVLQDMRVANRKILEFKTVPKIKKAEFVSNQLICKKVMWKKIKVRSLFLPNHLQNTRKRWELTEMHQIEIGKSTIRFIKMMGNIRKRNTKWEIFMKICKN